MAYDHQSIEQKWQKFWEENKTFRTQTPPHPLTPSPSEKGNETGNPISLRRGLGGGKKYILDMFPYPSGAGLHVGHPKGYTATDIISRYYHAKGYNVLHPMGFDAFGLPAENYAVKTGTHPRITTEANIETFTSQMKALGFSYDWDRMVDTTDPGYYQWTQWIFLELFKRGLAYEAEMPVNWCPALKAVLANEEVVDGKSEIGGHPVEKKLLRQWVLRITEYADRLITDLDGLDWPEGIKEMQRNWIGKSEGCEFRLMKSVSTPFVKGGRGDFVPEKNPQSLRDSSFTKELTKPTALILHGWDDAENRTDWHWMTSTKSELEKIGYDVIMEQLPGNNAPDLEKQLAFLEQYKDRLDERSVIIGHSMGGFLGMYFVERLGKKIDKLICVAPIFNGLIDHVDWSNRATGWDIGSASMRKNYNPEILKKNVNDWQVFLSENDWGIQYSLAKKHFEEAGASITSIPNAGHFCESDGYADFPALLESLDHIRVYTTRIDTVYSMAFAVVAPDHPKVQDFIAPEQREVCEDYIRNTKAKTDLDRTNDGKEKTGVFSGSSVINPYNGESVPLWIGDFVLGTYGTGAVFGDAHDERDFEFANKYGIDLKVSILPTSGKPEEIEAVKNLKTCFTDDGILVNSGEYDGLTSAEARRVLAEKAETEGFGHKKVNYKLRDWLFSRQRYWGEPIPLIHISKDDYTKLPRVKNLEDAKGGEASILVSSSGVEQSEMKDPGSWILRDAQNDGADGSTRGILATLQTRNDNNKEYLVIDGKIFSEVYEGLTGKLVIDSALPLLLPEVEKYEPSGDGQSPLATVPEWVNVRLADNLIGRRETNTMPQWGGSCWYYLRYMDAKNPDALAGREAMNYWQNVDEYVGGAEHAVLHLLYARFWHKVLYDIGAVPTKEPFQKLTNVGMILAYAYERADGGLVAVDLVEEIPHPKSLPGGEGMKIWVEKSTGLPVKQVVAKMSKSLKNVVNPTDIVREYGADTLRLYEMSMGAFTDTAPWNTEAIIGVRRFLDKAYSIFTSSQPSPKGEGASKNRSPLSEGEGNKGGGDDMKSMKLLHKTVKKVGEDIVEYKFNTAISALMILLNEGIPTDSEFALEWKEKFTILLHPFAPHMAEELFSLLLKGGAEERGGGFLETREILSPSDSSFQKEPSSIYFASWPDYDDFMLVDDEVTIAVQVNGKLRGTLTCLNGVMQEEVSSLAHEDPNIFKWIEGKTLMKEIYIPNKMLSIVVKD